MNDIIYLNERDTVATTIKELEPGTVIQAGGKTVTVTEHIPFAHKIAVVSVKQGEPVYKYGEPIGLATRDIGAGSLVHVHNVKSNRGLGE
ncbi:MAG: altronate hydrolase [Clostridia bacterium]|nr:altronate hydrolase [Clostridia bacterium]